jgi:hypothetical protein
MLPFGVTIPATVPQRPEIPEGLMNYLYIKHSDIIPWITKPCAYENTGKHFDLRVL